MTGKQRDVVKMLQSRQVKKMQFDCIFKGQTYHRRSGGIPTRAGLCKLTRFNVKIQKKKNEEERK